MQEKNEAAVMLGKRRWAGKSDAEKTAHIKIMLRALRKARKAKKGATK